MVIFIKTIFEMFFIKAILKKVSFIKQKRELEWVTILPLGNIDLCFLIIKFKINNNIVYSL